MPKEQPYYSNSFTSRSKTGYNPYERNGDRFGGGANRSRGFNDISFHYQEHPVFRDLKEFKKNFYQEHESSKRMSQEDVRAFREKHSMTLTGIDIPNPIMKFSESQFPSELQRLLTKAGFETPTPIQSQGWPMALTGRNVVGIAQTGSGKTLSFILPAIIHILGQAPVQRGDGPVALVLAPTRELACQIQAVAEEYGRIMGIRNSCLYGGASKGKQIAELQRSPQIVIATPGRLLDMIQSGKTTLVNVTYLVLDEADRMLDMGFENDLRKILAQIRPDRQMLMWSATWPKSVQKLARDFAGDHIKVQIGSTKLKANAKIKQTVTVMDESDKMEALQKILQKIWESIPGDDNKKAMERTIIFVNKKYACDNIGRDLWQQNWSVSSIHGDKSQQERDQALNSLKSGECPILVATDVAARGLDVAELKHVINYDFPNNIEDFVHRIGRTARGNDSTGNAYTFFTRNKQDVGNAADLVELMKDAGQPVPPELESLVVRRSGYGSGYGGGGSRGGYRGQNNYNRNSNWRGGSKRW